MPEPLSKTEYCHLQPKLYEVVLHKDNVTTMEFVCFLLMSIFEKDAEEAEKLMFKVHKEGNAVVGVFSYKDARAKAFSTTVLARTAGYPLDCTIEGSETLPLEVVEQRVYLKGQRDREYLVSISHTNDRKDYEKVLRLAVEWMSHSPFEVNPYVWAASAASNLNLDMLALGFCQKIQELEQENYHALKYQAQSHLNLLQPSDALKAANRAIELHPQHKDSLEKRDQAEWMLYANWPADRDLEEAIKENPQSGVAYIRRAIDRHDLYKFNDAVDDCNQALAFGSCIIAARIWRAYANLGMHRVGAADEDYRMLSPLLKTAQSKGQKTEILLLKAALLASNHYFEDALASIDLALSIEADRFNSRLARAYCLSMLKRLDDSNLILNQLLSPDISAINKAHVLSNRARNHIRSGDLTAASADIDAAIDAKPDLSSVLSTQALILLRSNSLAEAEIVLSKAIAINPFCAEAYEFRSRLYEKQGHTEKAECDKKVVQAYRYKADIQCL